jgi:hypothetical protein
MNEQTAQYKCDVCGATFRDADSLAKHMAVHDNAKNVDNEGKKDLEQGTDKPTADPSISNPGSPGPTLAHA